MDSPLEKLHKRLGWLRHDPDNAGLYRECANLALALRQFDVLRELSDRNFAETHGALAALDAMKGDAASASQRLAVARRLDPRSLSTQFAAALLEDPTLKSAQSQDIIQQTLLKMAGENGSALGKLLIQRPKR